MMQESAGCAGARRSQALLRRGIRAIFSCWQGRPTQALPEINRYTAPVVGSASAMLKGWCSAVRQMFTTTIPHQPKSMKPLFVTIAGAVALAAGSAYSQAVDTATTVDLISNLGELWPDPNTIGELRSPTFEYGFGAGYGTAFLTGPGSVNVATITLEQNMFDPSTPQDLRVRLLKWSVTPETGQSSWVPAGEFAQPEVTPDLTQWPESTSFVAYKPNEPVTLQPASQYLVAITLGDNGGPTPSVVFTPSTGFTAQPGWEIQGDYMGLEIAPDEFWVPDGPGHLKFKITGSLPPANKAPDVTNAHASVPLLWSPNGELVSFTIEGVTDPDGDPVTISIWKIEQDEPVLAPGDKTSPDAVVTGSETAQVRAERLGYGNGRVYKVSFRASDGKPDGTTEGVVFIGVPHDQRGGAEAVDDGLENGYVDSTGAH